MIFFRDIAVYVVKHYYDSWLNITCMVTVVFDRKKKTSFLLLKSYFILVHVAVIKVQGLSKWAVCLAPLLLVPYKWRYSVPKGLLTSTARDCSSHTKKTDTTWSCSSQTCWKMYVLSKCLFVFFLPHLISENYFES